MRSRWQALIVAAQAALPASPRSGHRTRRPGLHGRGPRLVGRFAVARGQARAPGKKFVYKSRWERNPLGRRFVHRWRVAAGSCSARRKAKASDGHVRAAHANQAGRDPGSDWHPGASR